MSLKEVSPGTYTGKVTDHGLEEVAALNQIKAFIVFEFKSNSGTTERIKWDGFILKKDGTINKHTMNTLMACGLKGKTENLNNEGSLNKTKEMLLTLEMDGDYLKCKWVNDPSASTTQKLIDVKKLKGFDLSGADSYLAMNTKAKTKPLHNYAPGAVNPPQMDTDEDIGF